MSENTVFILVGALSAAAAAWGIGQILVALSGTTRSKVQARLGQDAGAIQDAQAALTLDTAPANQYQVAGIYALVSARDPACRDEAFRLLTAALKGGFGRDLLAGDLDLDPIRDDPRFRQVLALGGG